MLHQQQLQRQTHSFPSHLPILTFFHVWKDKKNKNEHDICDDSDLVVDERYNPQEDAFFAHDNKNDDVQKGNHDLIDSGSLFVTYNQEWVPKSEKDSTAMYMFN